ncbi:MFS transporter [uncultured Sneathiella sp.]|uniref:MFS transporter n=1 Tax=uncultured Sneathiella sp. TaxID=879315 RepID=UPI0030ED0213|tara:strand:+ start:58141 stop:59499 length:1359 start_codon:yes stop_codon:yes gene_type:complete
MTAISEGMPREAGRLGKFSWALFDWANQPFFTVVTTFIFAPYFTSFVAATPAEGQAYWGYTQAIAGALIAILSPVFGSIADAGGARKPWILFFSVLCAIGAFSLWWAVPGLESGIFWILAGIVVGTIGVEFSIVFNNAMLPSLVPAGSMGRLSGFGWGLGYIGGLIALFIVLFGFSLPEVPLFGLSKVTHEPDRVTGPMSAIWLLVFIIPMLLFTPDRPANDLPKSAAVRQGLKSLMTTLRSLKAHRNIVFFLIARMFYNDGILALIGFSGIYAAGLFNWGTTELGIFGILINFFAIAGCFIGGYLDDRLGSKPTIVISVLGLAFASVGVLSISDGQVLFGLPAAMPVEEGALFASPAEMVFMVFAFIMGLFFGPAQAASRTLIARMAPPEKAGEFFGLFALSGKATAFVAPLMIGIVTSATGQQRPAMIVIFILLMIGAALMSFVREPAHK